MADYKLTEAAQTAIIESLDVLRFIAAHKLFGTGIGYIDAHLLIATKRAPGVRLWTRDKRLLAAAVALGIDVSP